MRHAAWLPIVLLSSGLAQDLADYEIKTVVTLDSTPRYARIRFGRKDGSKGGTIVEGVNGRLCTTTITWTAASRELTEWTDCVRMKTTSIAEREPAFPERPARPADCRAELDMPYKGAGVIQGIPLDRFETSDREATRAYWVAPSLGCLTIRVLIYFKNADGTLSGTSFEEPAEIKIGVPPNPALWAVPSGYREATKEERREAMRRFFLGLNER